jgi:hypothetical protein
LGLRSATARGPFRIQMKWEYMVRELSVQDSTHVLLMEEFLNEVGRDGWELVGVATTPTDQFTHLVYLKRAIAAGLPAPLEP